MKKIVCVKCKCEINPNEGYYNYPSGANCYSCGKIRIKKLEKALAKDPFGLKAAVELNRLRNISK